MTKNRLNEIASYLNERRNAAGISNLRSADDVELSDFGKFTKFAYELLDALDTPNDPSSPTPPTAGADCQQEADGGVGCSAWLGGNDKQENTSILNLLSLWSSQSERKSLISSSAQSSRPALSEPDKKSHTWLKRLRGMLLSVLRFGRTSQQTKSLKP